MVSSFSTTLTLLFVFVTFLYLRAWFRLRRKFPDLISFSKLATFLSGMFFLWLPAGSPLSGLDHRFLSAHMIQHLLLMAVAPPLLLLGAPAPLLRHILPGRFVQNVAGPILQRAAVRRIVRILWHPVFCWLAGTLTVIGWHVPALFELGMHSHAWHEIEQASFFVAGLLFWLPVMEPWPSACGWPQWSIPLYLFFATLPCDALSAYLTFCDHVVYRSYLRETSLVRVVALQDQQWAGALMWVCVTFIYLGPAVAVTVQLLTPGSRRTAGFDGILSQARRSG